MRSQVVDIPISGDDVVRLRPFEVRRENGACIVGANRSYLRVSSLGLQAIELLRDGAPPLSARRALEKSTRSAVTIEPLLEALVDAGMVESVGDRRLKARFAAPAHPTVSPAQAAVLFSRSALLFYLGIGGLAVLLSFLRPWPILLPRAIFAAAHYSVAAPLLLLLGLLNAAKHEIAHALAARSFGARAPVRFGCKFVFPALVTDLTDLWMSSRRRRLLAYSAGMASDALACAIVLLTAFAADGSSNAAAQVLLSAAFYVAAGSIAWQFAFFLRTDIYYILAAAVGSANLHAEAATYLRHCLDFLRGRVRRRAAWSVPARLYAAVMAAGYALTVALVASYLAAAGLATFAGRNSAAFAAYPPFDAADRAVLAAMVVLSAAAAVFARRAEARRTAVVYRLRWAPEDPHAAR